MAPVQPRDDRRSPTAVSAPGVFVTDERLLESFVTRRDEAAFEALARRYGPMVLGVCRRVLGNPHDAEDAFQATFLVLVRKAASIGQRELLGNWLYGVAYRTALDARTISARKQAREKQLHPLPEPAVNGEPDPGRELRPLLDEEVSRLPEKYRLPVVLCDLEGRTFRDVAQELGIPAGTLSGRLTAARGMLARRLARHGLTLSAGALTVVLSPARASAGVPPPLVAATVDAGIAAAAGNGTARTVSANVAVLAEGVLKAMLLKSQKLAATLLLTVGILVGLVAVVALVDRQAHDPRARVLPLEARGRRVIWSPDGKTLAVVTKVEKTFLGIQYYRRGSAIRLWDVEQGKRVQTLAENSEPGLSYQRALYSHDGKTIAATVTEEVVRPNVIMIRDVIKLWDAKTQTLNQTLQSDGHLISIDLSPDGKVAAGACPGGEKISVWNSETGKLERTLDTMKVQPWFVAFSPDGKFLLVQGQTRDLSGQVQMWDVQTWKLHRTFKLESHVNMVSASPDGKLIAALVDGVKIGIWNIEKGELVSSVKGHSKGPRSIAFSSDSKLIAAGCPDGKIHLWDAQHGALKETLIGHSDEVYSIAFSFDGKTLASTGQDQTLRLWNLESQEGEDR
jgi:RNA polymerase sigma factor (sigma-70 family)